MKLTRYLLLPLLLAINGCTPRYNTTISVIKTIPPEKLLIPVQWPTTPPAGSTNMELLGYIVLLKRELKIQEGNYNAYQHWIREESK